MDEADIEYTVTVWSFEKLPTVFSPFGLQSVFSIIHGSRRVVKNREGRIFMTWYGLEVDVGGGGT